MLRIDSLAANRQPDKTVVSMEGIKALFIVPGAPFSCAKSFDIKVKFSFKRYMYLSYLNILLVERKFGNHAAPNRSSWWWRKTRYGGAGSAGFVLGHTSSLNPLGGLR